MVGVVLALLVFRARGDNHNAVVRIGAFAPFAHTTSYGATVEFLGGAFKQVAVAAAVAATQFNERNASIIEEFGSLGPCDVQLEVSLFNTFRRSSDTLREYRKSYKHLDVIVGADEHDTTEMLAINCEVDKRPQISYGATSPTLDEYAWLMRTIISDKDSATRMVRFAQMLGWNKLGVLNVDDPWAATYRDSLIDACTMIWFVCGSASYQRGNSASLDLAIDTLFDYRIVFMVFPNDELAFVAERFVANNAITDEHAFVFMETILTDDALLGATSDTVELVRGGFVLSIHSLVENVRRLQAALKRQKVEDFTSMLDAVEPFGTLDAGFFNRAFEFSHIFFAFDAIATIGIAACNATPSAEALLAAMHGVSFEGITGLIKFDEAGNRPAETVTFDVLNFIGNDTTGVTAVHVATWKNDKWELYGKQYTFRDGSSTAPVDNVVCPRGEHLDNDGRCRACPPGRFQQNEGASTCMKCPASSYQDLTGQQRCKLCGENAEVGWEGSTSAKDCRCLVGYYTPTWPLSECRSCDRPSLKNKVVCEGGLALPYPRDAYWLDLSNSATTKLRAYRCRHAFLCVGGTRPTACAKGYAEAHNDSCLSASGELMSLGRPNGWCDFGHDYEEPLCEEPGNSRFAVATFAPRCPARVNHLLFTIFCYAVLFALFSFINDFIRKNYKALDLVLTVFQDIGILTSFRLYWPKQLQYIIVFYHIALFDVDVLEPTCAYPEWGHVHTFFLMFAMPIVHLVMQCAYSAVVTSGGLNAWRSALCSHLSFVVTSMPVLMSYSSSAFFCRRFVGHKQRVFAESPADSCDSPMANAMRVVASIYFAYLVVVCGVCTYHMAMLLRRNELHKPDVLRMYGFLYKSYRSDALYWSSVRFSKQAALTLISQALWKSPFSQSLAALTVLFAVAMEHNRVRPFISHQENRLEEFGVFVSMLTLVLGMCFTAFEMTTTDISQPGERNTFIFLFIVSQFIYLVYAIVETVHDACRARSLFNVILDSFGSTVRDSASSSTRVSVTPTLASLAGAESKLPDGDTNAQCDSSVTTNDSTPSISTKSLRNLELFKTFRGESLLSFFSSECFLRQARNEIGRIVKLEVVLGPYVSDSALTSNYSNLPEATFYRHLDTSFPILIDLLMHSTDKRRAVLSEAISIIERYTYLMHDVGGYQDSHVVESIHRSSVLFFMTQCGPHVRSQFRNFITKLVDAQPSLKRFRDAAKKRKLAIMLQRRMRTWLARQHSRPRTVHSSLRHPLRLSDENNGAILFQHPASVEFENTLEVKVDETIEFDIVELDIIDESDGV
ncbi:hypothetical protein CTAYLR_002193 [Chrysophaeum taylorii]|uniref:Receptor ligand binding region domain-containing protein n=1 Tax=Chrysophaeum taylorii TaxID=2483200 RepID=A0AAD7UPS5_9STRA|nr:hypothetical protein CTAYLR_002193 [Chrysophaeum taylorii]